MLFIICNLDFIIYNLETIKCRNSGCTIPMFLSINKDSDTKKL